MKKYLYFNPQGYKCPNPAHSFGLSRKPAKLSLVIFSFFILFLLYSCASTPPADPTLNQKPDPDNYLEAQMPEEPVDQACSFFHFLWGKTAEASGNLEEALEAYQKTIICDPGADHVMKNLAVLLIKLGKKEEAAKWLNKLIKKPPVDINLMILLANLYSSMGDVDNAVRIFNQVLVEKPGDENTMLLMGTLYARNRRFDEARNVLEELTLLKPGSYLAYHYLARLYHEMEMTDKALATYLKVLELNWTVPLAMETAEFCRNKKLYDESIKIYQEILVYDNSNEKAREKLADTLLRLNKFEDAIKELEKLKEFSRDPLRVDYNIGRILLENNELDRGIAHFIEMSESYPQVGPINYLLGLAYFQKKNTEKAKDFLKNIQPADIGYEDAVHLRVKILQDEKQFELVEQILKENIQNNVTRKASYYIILGSVFYKQGKNEDAAKTFIEAAAEYPTDPKIFFEYALFLEKTGDSDQALSKMEKVITLEPDNPYALNYVAYTWAEKNINLEKALKYIKEAVQLRPDDGFIKDSLGWVHFKLGQHQLALEALMEAVKIESDDPTINEHLGDAYQQLNNHDSAVSTYKKAIKLYKEKDEQKKINLQKKIDLLTNEPQKNNF
jgi:tetratricopeptide (TPR) repeat protein